MPSVPVLVLAYIRPEMTMRLLQLLLDLGITKIYISMDGPRNDFDAKKQISLIEDIERLFSKKPAFWKIQYLPKNFGVGRGVLAGLDWFFNNEDYGIVIEDDLEFGEDFLSFCANHLLNLDELDDIWMISGMQVLDEYSKNGSPILSGYPMIWGWATTANKWRKIRNASSKQEILSPMKFGSRRSYFWNRGFARVQKGKLDTWDLPLVLTFLSNKKLCLISSENLVKNLGYDEKASHTEGLIFPLNHPIQKLENRSNFDVKELGHSKNYDALLEKRVFNFRKMHSLFGYPYFFFQKLFLLYTKNRFDS